MHVARDGITVLELDKNITVIVDTIPGLAGAAMGFWFPVGSAAEREGERGLSHFVEHMVFKGAGDRGAEDIARAIDRVGGYLNAFTERDTVCVHCVIPAGEIGLAIDILVDMVYSPRFDRDEFEREKSVIMSEILAADDDLEEAGQDEFFAMTYPGQAVGRR